MEEERSGGFLPPEPPGPEPELGDRPAPQAPAPEPPPPAYGPPAGAGPQAPPAGPQAPPPGHGYPPPPGGYYPPQGQWGGQQPGTWQPQQPQPWGYPPPAPDNGSAVASLVLSLVSVGLLFLTAGLSSVVSLGCSIAGIVYGRKGIKRVDAGETPKNRGIAQAGFWIGWVGLACAVIATIAWIVIVILIATDEQFRQDFEDEFDNSRSIRAAMLVTGCLARFLA